MNGEMEHIKEFVKKHLEVCYWEMAEETMLINPFCGVIRKFITENKLEEERIRSKKLLIEYKKKELQNKFEEVTKKEIEINEAIKKDPALIYIIHESEIDKLCEIAKTISQYFGIEIERKTRLRNYVYARQLAHYYARKLTRSSLFTIGAWIGKKDHATVLYSIRVIESLKRYSETEKHISEFNKIFNIKD